MAMSMSREAYDRLVGLIYDAAEQPLKLKDSLRALAHGLSAAGAHIVGFDKKTQEVVLSAIAGLPLLGELEYTERYGRIDPRAPACFASNVGEVISCHHFITQDFVDRSEFYQDFYIPYGCRYLSAVKLFENDSRLGILGVITPVTDPPFADDALQFIAAISTHFQRALRIIEAQSRMQDQWSIMKRTLDGFDYGALICDEAGQVLVGNEAALAILDEGDGIRLLDDHLAVDDPVTRARLRDALLHELASPTPGAIRQAILVDRPSGLSAYQVILRRIDPGRTLLGFDGKPLWSVLISDPARASVPTMRAISMLYGLTPAETRIAAFLIDGLTPEQMAGEMYVKVSTIRAQLKSLFAKTGTGRQAELVSLLLKVPRFRESRAR